MQRIRKIEVVFILIACLSPMFTEATRTHVTVADLSNTSTTGFVSSCNHEVDDSNQTKIDGEQDVGRKWKSMESWNRKLLSTIYKESLPFLKHVNDNLDISLTCKRDLRKMLEGIDQNKHWAVQMFDSFGYLPAGIGSGTFSSLGDYDLCLDVNVPDSFQGQYCNLDFTLPMPTERKRYERSRDIQEITRVLQPDGYFALFKEHFHLFYLLNLRSAICVPSTCSKDELQKIATTVAQKMDLSAELHIPNCEVMNKEVRFDRTEITVMFILGVLLFLVLSSTAFEIYLKITHKKEENAKKNMSLPIKCLLCFSLCTNTKELLKPDTQKDSINVFNGMRALTTILILNSHVALYQNYQASSSVLNLSSRILNNIIMYVVINSWLFDQSYFFMSNVIHAYQVMKKKERIDVKKHILKRIWRLAPPFMFVIACVILIPHLGSGPVWKETIKDGFSDKCHSKWWTNVLFINNFIRNQDMCLEWLWFIAADFQIYLLSLLVLIPMQKNPRLALIITIFIMIGANAIYAVFHMYLELQPAPVLAIEDCVSRYFLSDFFDRGLFPIYIYFSSACIGLAVGIFLVIRPSELHISSKVNVLLWLASISTLLATLLCVYIWNGGNLPSVVVSTVYAVASKFLWNAALAWITIACMTGNGGFVSEFLSLPIFVYFGRISYMLLLIHSMIHLVFNTGSTRSIIHVDLRSLVNMFAGNFSLSLVFAFVFTLLFESPFTALGKLMFAEKTPERTNLSNEINSKETKLSNGINSKENPENLSSTNDERNSDKKIV